MLLLDEILNWTGGELINKNQIQFGSVGTDTRKDLSGKLFLALRGENFDAHQFIEKAILAGADGIVIDKKNVVESWNFSEKDITVILVGDTLSALQKMAYGYRKKLNKKIIGITGSSGKTTTKEFTHQILSTYFSVHCNKGSFNNHWGVPFSLLDIKETHDMAIIEMGMNHAGELENLVKIADPDVVVCTMVGVTHMQHFGSQRAIAEAKEEIYKYSSKNCIKVFNLDDSYVFEMYLRVKDFFAKDLLYTFSEKKSDANVYLQVKDFLPDSLLIHGRIGNVTREVKIPIFGAQNITNILAACTLALAMKMPEELIWKSLGGLKTNWGRNQILKLINNATLIFDGYNANPDSVKSLLSNISNIKTNQRKIVVLSDMLELGEGASSYHKEIGRLTAESGFDEIYYYGAYYESFVQGVHLVSCSSNVVAQEKIENQFLNQLEASISSNSLIAVKGSRGMKTEQVVLRLIPTFSCEKD